MNRSKDAKGILFSAALLFVAGLLGACSGRVQTLEALPEPLRGKVQIVDVGVEKRRDVASADIELVLRRALLEALDKEPRGGQAMNLVVVIEDYQGPEGQISGNRTSGLAGANSRLEGRVYVVRPETGAAVAEFRTLAQYEPGAAGPASGSTDIRRYLVDEFAAAVIEEIY